MSNVKPMTPKFEAQLAAEFLKTRFGEHFITQLSLHYNTLHQSAEGDLSMEQKALKVERASGVKWAIDFLTTKRQLLENGYFPKDDAS